MDSDTSGWIFKKLLWPSYSSLLKSWNVSSGDFKSLILFKIPKETYTKITSYKLSTSSPHQKLKQNIRNSAKSCHPKAILYADSTPALIMGAYDGYWYIFGTSRNCLRKYSKLSLSNIEQVLKSFWKGKWKQIKEKHPLIRLRFNFQVCSAAIYCKKLALNDIWWFFVSLELLPITFDLRNMFYSQS